MEIGERLPKLHPGDYERELVARTEDGRPIIATLDAFGRIRTAEIWVGPTLSSGKN